MTTGRTTDVEQRAGELAERVDDLQRTIGRRIVGQTTLVRDVLIAVFAGGHVLLEGLPGLGKTRLVRTLGTALGLETGRIQFTPDLMPSDVTGTRIVDESGDRLSFRFQRGPVFTNLLLADEINRTTPRTQSAMLEAMQEGAVTVAEQTHELPRPFHVIATQNPIELEGTYPLPEAQLDRFLSHLVVEMPALDDLVAVLDQTTKSEEPDVRPVLSREQVLEIQALARQVICGDHLLRYVATLLRITHPRDENADERTRRFVRYGASPRAGQAVVLTAKVRALLDRRPSVSRADLDAGMLAALRHRIVLGFEAEAEGVQVADLIDGWRRQAQATLPG
jgi:MoxR-like ATPase